MIDLTELDTVEQHPNEVRQRARAQSEASIAP